MQIKGQLGPNIALTDDGVYRAGSATQLANETDDRHRPFLKRNRTLCADLPIMPAVPRVIHEPIVIWL